MANARPADPLLSRLIELLQRLHTETADFLEQADDPQVWYNRGYANGMLAALKELGFQAVLPGQLQADPPDLIHGQERLPWGQAYLHGLEQGARETREVLPPAAG